EEDEADDPRALDDADVPVVALVERAREARDAEEVDGERRERERELDRAAPEERPDRVVAIDAVDEREGGQRRAGDHEELDDEVAGERAAPDREDDDGGERGGRE